jgi:hypothetical protein
VFGARHDAIVVMIVLGWHPSKPLAGFGRKLVME